MTPYDRFLAAQKRATLLTAHLGQVVDDMLEIQDADGASLVEKHKLDRAVMSGVPKRLDDMRVLVLLSLADDQVVDNADEHDPEDLAAIERALLGEDAPEDQEALA